MERKQNDLNAFGKGEAKRRKKRTKKDEKTRKALDSVDLPVSTFAPPAAFRSNASSNAELVLNASGKSRLSKA